MICTEGASLVLAIGWLKMQMARTTYVIIVIIVNKMFSYIDIDIIVALDTIPCQSF
jgi:hypothetical protein